jgi:hypothetical protein
MPRQPLTWGQRAWAVAISAHLCLTAMLNCSRWQSGGGLAGAGWAVAGAGATAAAAAATALRHRPLQALRSPPAARRCSSQQQLCQGRLRLLLQAQQLPASTSARHKRCGSHWRRSATATPQVQPQQQLLQAPFAAASGVRAAGAAAGTLLVVAAAAAELPARQLRRPAAIPAALSPLLPSVLPGRQPLFMLGGPQGAALAAAAGEATLAVGAAGVETPVRQQGRGRLAGALSLQAACRLASREAKPVCWQASF